MRIVQTGGPFKEARRKTLKIKGSSTPVRLLFKGAWPVFFASGGEYSLHFS